MPTLYKRPIKAFFTRIEENPDFFNYLGLDDEKAMELAVKRAKNFLLEATSILSLKCNGMNGIFVKDDAIQAFEEDWTETEVFLVGSIMFEQCLDREIAKLKCVNVNYTSTNLRVFDPKGDRESFLKIYETVCKKNERLIDDYNNQDRLTGKYVTVNYPSYDE